jgi:hypothetical protein
MQLLANLVRIGVVNRCLKIVGGCARVVVPEQIALAGRGHKSHGSELERRAPCANLPIRASRATELSSVLTEWIFTACFASPMCTIALMLRRSGKNWMTRRFARGALNDLAALSITTRTSIELLSQHIPFVTQDPSER